MILAGLLAAALSAAPAFAAPASRRAASIPQPSPQAFRNAELLGLSAASKDGKLRLAGADGAYDRYGEMTSAVFSSSFPFDRVSADWDLKSSTSASGELWVQVRQEGILGPWYELGPSAPPHQDDFGRVEGSTLTLLQPGDALRYRLVFHGGGRSTPVLSRLVFEYSGPAPQAAAGPKVVPYLDMTPALVSTAAAAALALSTPVVTVHFPQEGAQLPYLQATYILGNVQPPTATLTIDGQAVKVHPKGGFLAYLPVHPGDFTFECAATAGGRTGVYDRKVHVDAPPLPPDTKEPTIDKRSLQPAADMALRPGDWVRVAARGPAGMKGTFRIFGVAKDLALAETQPGLYEGGYVLRPADEAKGAVIRISLDGPQGKIKADAPGHLTVLDSPPAVALFDRPAFELNNVRSALGQGFRLFVPNGIKTIVSGHIGDESRIDLAPGVTGWIPTNQLRFLPEGTPPVRSELGSMELGKGSRSTTLRMELSEAVPYSVEELPGMVRLTLYHTWTHTNWITFDDSDPNVREVRWSQDADGVSRVDVWLTPEAQLFGYNLSFPPGHAELELRWAPPPAPKGHSPLEGMTIVLDPGHSPSDPGRVGPLGTTERQHNLKTAQVLEALLKKEGANVVMTRTNNDAEVSLQQREDIAWQAKADAFLSLHNNALPLGADPFDKPRGYNVFFYQAHSHALAQAIHKAYQKEVPLADEGLKFGDLFIPRTTKMPTVLVESAYFIYPDQEQLLLSDAFQQKLGKALAMGLKDFFRQARRMRPEAPERTRKKPKAAAAPVADSGAGGKTPARKPKLKKTALLKRP